MVSNIAWLALGFCLFTYTSSGLGASYTNQPPETPNPASAIDEATKSEVAKWVKQLDAEKLSDRDAAEEAILKIGPPAIPLLPKIDDKTSAEVGLRLKRLSDKLQSQSVSFSIDPSVVSLQGEMTLAEALERIAKQSGNKIAYNNIPAKSVQFDIEQLSFWEALDEILDAGELDIDPYAAVEQAVALKPRDPKVMLRQLRAGYSGPFRIEPVEITAVRSLLDPKQNKLKVQALIEWEPRLQPIFVKFPMQDVLLKLGDGTTLSAANPEEASEYSVVPGSRTVDVEFTMSLPARDLDTADGLTGKIVAAIPGKKTQLAFEGLEKTGKKSQQVGNLIVTIDRVRKNGGLYEFITNIELKNSEDTMDSFRSWVLSNEAYLLDGKGKRLENVGSHTYKLGGGEVGIAYLFDLAEGPEKYRFIYEAAGVIAQQEFTFELPEILLP